MARKPKFDILKAVEALEPNMRKAFLASIEDVRSAAQLSVIVKALEDGRTDDVIRALHLSPEFFAPLDDAIRAAYLEGGRQSLAALPALAGSGAARLEVRFGMIGNARAEGWVRNHSSTLIREIVSDQVASVRGFVEGAVRNGVGPRTTALDIVGRINRATRKREGGILGLTQHQTSFVTNARSQLQSGDPGAMAQYLTRTRRDKRFDSVVKRAIAEGRPVAAKDVENITRNYQNRLLKLRGDTIARTESLGAFNAGQQEGLQQLVDRGAVQPNQVRRTWRTASDSRVRDSHQNINGASVGLNERFANGLLFPLEAGAPAQEVINCRCVAETRIDFLGNL